MATSSAEAAERMRVTLDLFELGEAMTRQRLRRKHPRATDAEIEVLIVEWLERRPGAEDGDADGHRVPWRRRRT
jgi:hypothetical protein